MARLCDLHRATLSVGAGAFLGIKGVSEADAVADMVFTKNTPYLSLNLNMSLNLQIAELNLELEGHVGNKTILLKRLTRMR